MARHHDRAVDEQALIAGWRGGDITAFNELLRIHQAVMFDVAYHLLANREAAGALVQAAILPAFRAVHQFHGGSFRSWLLRIVTHRCYGELRARRRRSTHALDSRPPAASRLPVLPSAREPSAASADPDRRAHIVQHAVLTLPPQQRAILVLSDVHGLSYQEIAVALDMPRRTVRSRLSGARVQLRDTLQGTKQASRTP